MAEPDGLGGGPHILRLRQEIHRRSLTVLRVEQPHPSMVRTVLGGSQLGGFVSPGFDDHVKLFFPAAEGTAPPAGPRVLEGWLMRDFTPRRHDAAAGELWIDFFLHDGGPAAGWARQARAGQTLLVAGPRGSVVVEIADIGLHVLIGDEAALPAIYRRLEELPAGARALVLVETEPGAAWPAPVSPAQVELHWVPRDGRPGGPAHELIAALTSLPLPQERCFCWVAGESQSARALRRYLVEERGIGRRWVKAAGYWQRGAAGVHERLED